MLNLSRYSSHFMEPQVLSPCSQQPPPPSLAPFLSQVNLVYTLQSYFRKISINSIISFSKKYVSCRLSYQNPTCYPRCSLFWDVTQRRSVVSEPPIVSCFKHSSTAWPLKMVPIRRAETSVTDYQFTLRNIP